MKPQPRIHSVCDGLLTLNLPLTEGLPLEIQNGKPAMHDRSTVQL